MAATRPSTTVTLNSFRGPPVRPQRPVLAWWMLIKVRQDGNFLGAAACAQFLPRRGRGTAAGGGGVVAPKDAFLLRKPTPPPASLVPSPSRGGMRNGSLRPVADALVSARLIVMRMMRALCIAIVTAAGCVANLASAQAGAAPPYDHCFAGPFVLTFERGSAQLTKWHREVLATVRSESKHCGGEMLIESYRSNDEPPDLQRRRASAVFDYLKNSGAATGRVAIGLQPRPWPTPTEDGRQRHIQVFLAIWR